MLYTSRQFAILILSIYLVFSLTNKELWKSVTKKYYILLNVKCLFHLSTHSIYNDLCWNSYRYYTAKASKKKKIAIGRVSAVPFITSLKYLNLRPQSCYLLPSEGLQVGDRWELSLHTQTTNSWPKAGHEYVEIISIIPTDMCPMDTFLKTRNSTVAVVQFPYEYLAFT